MTIWLDLAKQARLETKRLILRPFVFADEKDFSRLLTDANNGNFVYPLPLTRDRARQVLVADFMQRPLGKWAICHKTDDRVIGAIYFNHERFSKQEGELSYLLHHPYWRQGLMSEALFTVIALSFTHLGLERLRLHIKTSNTASLSLAQKLGFSLEKHYKGSDRHSRQLAAYYLMSLSRDHGIKKDKRSDKKR